jgi:hypothetical protein
MLTKSGVKLIDFGLAKVVPIAAGGIAGMTAAATQSAPLTGQGTILGTPAVHGARAARRKDVDARTDIFPFGSIVYAPASERVDEPANLRQIGRERLARGASPHPVVTRPP